MTGPIRTEALIHDLAIVLAGVLHQPERPGYSPDVAASRIRDVLGIAPGEPTRGIENRLADAFTCACCCDNQCECLAEPDDIACGQADEN